MGQNITKHNSNVPNTDFIDLDTIKLDLNDLEMAQVVVRGDKAFGILFMKNGHSHIVDSTVIGNLDGYCR